jgi:methylated-DNA-[protein]-cysteine S-methyltransferase
MQTPLRFAHVSTPFKHALVAVDERGALVHVAFYRRAARLSERLRDAGAREDPDACRDVTTQLGEYFAGVRRAFDLKIAARGSAFERHVWAALCEIPYGRTASYLDVTRLLAGGTPRDVGAANAANPLAIVVPCHRVIGHDGMLVGYAGGLQMKQQLLDLEREVSRIGPAQLSLL